MSLCSQSIQETASSFSAGSKYQQTMLGKQANSVSRRQSNNAHPGMANVTPESDKYLHVLLQMTEGMGTSCLNAHTNRKREERAKPKSGSTRHQLGQQNHYSQPTESSLIISGQTILFSYTSIDLAPCSHKFSNTGYIIFSLPHRGLMVLATDLLC